MSFTTRICGNYIASGLRSLLSNATPQMATRNFHALAAGAVGPTTSASLAPAAAVTGGSVAGLQRLLAPFNSLLSQVAGFKVKARLKRRCKDCYFVIRQQRHYVICPTHPRHKQMSMKQREYKTWVLTHASQSKIRDY